MRDNKLLRKSIAVMSIIFIWASIAIPSNEAKDETLKIGDQVPKFTLKDADDNEYSFDKILSKDKKDLKLLVLIIGDSTTRQNGNQWAKELDKLYKGKKELAIFMIADLRNLPFFATESMVKWGTKKENLPITILLDWKGKVSEQYKTQRGKSNIYIIDLDRKVRFYFAEKCSPENIKLLNSKIQEALKDKKS